MRYDYVIFDFDGTLADTVEFFMGLFDVLADRHAFRKLTREELEPLRRQPARKMFEAAGIPLWKLPLIATSARQLMTDRGGDLRLFGGVDAMLRALRSHGIRVAICTSNSEANVRRALGDELSALVHDYSCGAAIFGKRSKLAKLSAKSGIAKSRTLCVGDEFRDIDAARDAGLKCGVVAWGATPFEAMVERGPDERFESVDDIVRVVTQD